MKQPICKKPRTRIKKDLGPDAIILSMKKISDRPPLIEILAARDEKTECLSSPNNQLPKKEDRQGDLLSCLTKEIHELKSSVEGLKQKISSSVRPLRLERNDECLIG